MSHALFLDMLHSLWQTIEMVGISGVISAVVGIVLGILLYISDDKGLKPHKPLYYGLAAIVDAVRSIPFIILLVAIVPLTRLIAGTSIGTDAAMVPLTLGAIPFVARLVETSLREVPYALLEMGQAIGATSSQIIWRILLPEALPGIVSNITVTFIALVSYSAMAGAIGGGGLGDLAIRYGYQRFDISVMVYTVLILIALVQLIQLSGNYLMRKVNHR